MNLSELFLEKSRPELLGKLNVSHEKKIPEIPFQVSYCGV